MRYFLLILRNNPFLLLYRLPNLKLQLLNFLPSTSPPKKTAPLAKSSSPPPSPVHSLHPYSTNDSHPVSTSQSPPASPVSPAQPAVTPPQVPLSRPPVVSPRRHPRPLCTTRVRILWRRVLFQGLRSRIGGMRNRIRFFVGRRRVLLLWIGVGLFRVGILGCGGRDGPLTRRCATISTRCF